MPLDDDVLEIWKGQISEAITDYAKQTKDLFEEMARRVDELEKRILSLEKGD